MSEQILHGLFEVKKPEEQTSRRMPVEINQKIDVAFGAEVLSDGRAEGMKRPHVMHLAKIPDGGQMIVNGEFHGWWLAAWKC